MTIAQVLRKEADDCELSSSDTRNTSENRNIFHVATIVLRSIADRLDQSDQDEKNT